MEDDGSRSSELSYYESVENEEVQYEEEDLEDEPDQYEEEDVEDEPEETLVPNSVVTGNCLHYKGKRYEDLSYEDLKNTQFESLEEVDTFYKFYSLAMGFSFRKEKLDKDANGIVVRRQLVCSKEGTRKQQGPPKGNQNSCSNNPVSHNLGSRSSFMKSVGIPEKGKRNSHSVLAEGAGNTNKRKCPHSRRETRWNCPARLTVKRCKKTGKLKITEFITQHNHALAPPEMKSFLKKNRKVQDHSMAQVTALQKVSVKTCQAYELLVHQAGGFEFVGFTIKDLYNKVDAERRELYIDGDGQAAISFMNLKAAKDPDFYCLFSVDEEDRLANLFWRDTRSLIDYNNFGDVLILDSTYKTNIYEKPLAVFVGVNNHRATVLFGFALLVDEKEETYLWALSAFLASMKGKKPISVITDGDDAMRNAVNRLIPEARHRLCAWHIAKNVVKNVRNVDVQRDFCHLIFAGLSVEDWEASWHYMVAIHGLQDNRWITSMYNKRDRWAEAYFRNHFFGGMCSTQRCEGTHRMMKKGLRKIMRLCQFLPRVDQTVDHLRYNNLYDDFRSLDSKPVIGDHMRPIQEQVGAKFTHDIFLLIKDQILFESKFVVVDRVEYENRASTLFVLTQYGKPERTWHVTYFHSRPTFTCSCQLFESDGIPCCHIFAVMKAKLITNFPESLVTKRWTKEASPTKTNLIARSGNVPDVDLQVARYGQMMSDCSRICHKASFTDEAYEETCDAFGRLIIRSQNWKVPDNNTNVPDVGGLHPNVIRDPEPCRTKGAQTRAANIPNEERQPSRAANIPSEPSGRGCGFCSRPGHNIRTCPIRLNAGNTNDVNTEPQCVTNEGAQSSVFAQGAPGQSFGAHTSTAAFPSNSQYDEDSVFLAQTNSQHMIHHVEEARTWDFFSGHQNISR